MSVLDQFLADIVRGGNQLVPIQYRQRVSQVVASYGQHKE